MCVCVCIYIYIYTVTRVSQEEDSLPVVWKESASMQVDSGTRSWLNIGASL